MLLVTRSYGTHRSTRLTLRTRRATWVWRMPCWSIYLPSCPSRAGNGTSQIPQSSETWASASVIPCLHTPPATEVPFQTSLDAPPPLGRLHLFSSDACCCLLLLRLRSQHPHHPSDSSFALVSYRHHSIFSMWGSWHCPTLHSEIL